MITLRAGPGCTRLLPWALLTQGRAHLCPRSDPAIQRWLNSDIPHFLYFSFPFCNSSPHFYRWSWDSTETGTIEGSQSLFVPGLEASYVRCMISSLVLKNSSQTGFEASLPLCSRAAWHAWLKKSSAITYSILCNCLEAIGGMVAISLTGSTSTLLCPKHFSKTTKEQDFSCCINRWKTFSRISFLVSS